MLIVERKQLKRDFKHLIKVIQTNHPEEQDYHELFVKHKPVKNLTTTAWHYATLTDDQGSLHIRYQMATSIKNVDLGLVGRKIEKVCFFEDFVEYEADRIKSLSKNDPTSPYGLNPN